MNRATPGWDLEGWPAIAEALAVSEETARRWAAEGMPVYTFETRTVARRDELNAWVAQSVAQVKLPEPE